MGLVLEPGEVRGWVQDIQGKLQNTDKSYQDALRVIEDFANQDELAGESWEKLKNRLLTYHQLAIYGMTIAKEEIESDLAVLEREIGSEYLNEDELRDNIRRLKEECRRYEQTIEKWERIGLILGGLLFYGIIGYNKNLLANAQQQIKALEKKLELLEDIDCATSKLFTQTLTIYAAVRNAIKDMEVTINGEGKLSSGDWKSLLRKLWESEHGTLADPEGVLQDVDKVYDAESDQELNSYMGRYPIAYIDGIIKSYEKHKMINGRFVLDNNGQTIAYGHDVLAGEDFSSGLSQQEAEELLISDLNKKYNTIERYIKTLNSNYGYNLNFNNFSENEMLFLVDFAFNRGSGLVKRPELEAAGQPYSSLAILIVAVSENDDNKIITTLMEETKNLQGIYYDGLALRRMDEYEILKFGDFVRDYDVSRDYTKGSKRQ